MIRRDCYLTSTLLLILVTAGNCGGFETDSGDLQWWSTGGIDFDIDKDWTVSVEEQIKLGNDAGNMFYQHTDLGFRYKGFSEWLELGLNFMKVDEKDGGGVWRRENRPHLNLTVKGSFKGLAVSNRSRLEYRDRETAEDRWRYRNKTTVELTGLKLKPYLADDIFIYLGEDNVSTNRFYAGFSFDVYKNVKGSLYYLLQSSKVSGGWRDANVIGTNLKVAF